MPITSSSGLDIFGCVDRPVSPSHVAPLVEMISAHFAGFEAVESLDLDGVEPSASFDAAWDG